MKRSFLIEIANPNTVGIDWHYVDLSLPAEVFEIKDAFDRARISTPIDSTILDISIYNCEVFPPLSKMRLDSPTVLELNYLAQRYASLNDDEIAVLNSVWQKYITEEDDPVSINTLINLTYGLDKVNVMPNISDLAELGTLVIENDLHPDVEAVPEESLYLLDKRLVGKLQQEVDGGIFNKGKYFMTVDYSLPNIYNGQIPQTEVYGSYAFRLELTKLPVDDEGNLQSPTEWLGLPASAEDIKAIEKKLGLADIKEALYLDYVTIIPQVDRCKFQGMHEFEKLNDLARMLVEMTPSDQVKFKAILVAEDPSSIEKMIDIVNNMSRYEFNPYITTPEGYFRTFLSVYLPTDFDRRWLDNLEARQEGIALRGQTGSIFTEYGLVSVRGGHLFEPMPQEPIEDQLAEMDDDEPTIKMGGM